MAISEERLIIQVDCSIPVELMSKSYMPVTGQPAISKHTAADRTICHNASFMSVMPLDAKNNYDSA